MTNEKDQILPGLPQEEENRLQQARQLIEEIRQAQDSAIELARQVVVYKTSDKLQKQLAQQLALVEEKRKYCQVSTLLKRNTCEQGKREASPKLKSKF